MLRTHRRFVPFLAAITTVAVAGVANAGTYSVTYVTEPSASSRPTVIADDGTLYGETSVGIFSRPARWVGGTIQQVPGIDGTFTGVSSNGLRVSGTRTRSDFSLGAIRWNAVDGYEDLTEGLTGEGLAINNDGTLVGASGGDAVIFNPAGSPIVIRLSDGGPGFGARANGINDAGQVAGIAIDANGRRRAFLYNPGQNTTELAGLGGEESRANAINASGWVVGAAERPVADGGTRAMLWRDGLAFDLGISDGATSSEAVAINASGVIIGNDTTIGGFFQGTTAWIWNNGIRADLNDLISPGQLTPGWTIDQAVSINDAGQILVRVFNAESFDSRYAVLNIIPTPGAGAALVLAGLVAARRRR